MIAELANGSFQYRDFHKADESALMAISFVFTNSFSKVFLLALDETTRK
jgi:hypothetical protein